MAWEYKVENLEGMFTKEGVEEVLNKHGQEGWELVSSQFYWGDPEDGGIRQTVPEIMLILKRQSG